MHGIVPGKVLLLSATFVQHRLICHIPIAAIGFPSNLSDVITTVSLSQDICCVDDKNCAQISPQMIIKPGPSEEMTGSKSLDCLFKEFF
jgi:hypothetical protein